LYKYLPLGQDVHSVAVLIQFKQAVDEHLSHLDVPLMTIKKYLSGQEVTHELLNENRIVSEA
jgi:hypothetical protein